MIGCDTGLLTGSFPGMESLVTIKLIMGINLLNYARRRSVGNAMERRIREDEQVNFYGRPPIGEGKAEQASFLLSICASTSCSSSFARSRCVYLAALS